MSFLVGLIQGMSEGMQEQRKTKLQEELLKAQLGELKAKQKRESLTRQALLGQIGQEDALRQLAAPPQEESDTVNSPLGLLLKGAVAGGKGLYGLLTGQESPQPYVMQQPAVAASAPSSLKERLMLAATINGDVKAMQKLSGPDPMTPEQLIQFAQRVQGNSGGATTMLPTMSLDANGQPKLSMRATYPPEYEAKVNALTTALPGLSRENAQIIAMQPQLLPEYLKQMGWHPEAIRAAEQAIQNREVDLTQRKATASAVGGATPAAQGLGVTPQTVLGANALGGKEGQAMLGQASPTAQTAIAGADTRTLTNQGAQQTQQQQQDAAPFAAAYGITNQQAQAVMQAQGPQRDALVKEFQRLNAEATKAYAAQVTQLPPDAPLPPAPWSQPTPPVDMATMQEQERQQQLKNEADQAEARVEGTNRLPAGAAGMDVGNYVLRQALPSDVQREMWRNPNIGPGAAVAAAENTARQKNMETVRDTETAKAEGPANAFGVSPDVYRAIQSQSEALRPYLLAQATAGKPLDMQAANQALQQARIGIAAAKQNPAKQRQYAAMAKMFGVPEEAAIVYDTLPTEEKSAFMAVTQEKVKALKSANMPIDGESLVSYAQVNEQIILQQRKKLEEEFRNKPLGERAAATVADFRSAGELMNQTLAMAQAHPEVLKEYWRDRINSTERLRAWNQFADKMTPEEKEFFDTLERGFAVYRKAVTGLADPVQAMEYSKLSWPLPSLPPKLWMASATKVVKDMRLIEKNILKGQMMTRGDAQERLKELESGDASGAKIEELQKRLDDINRQLKE